ncbi:MAG TPA: helix-turn-helix domain-containing protein [Bryobacteraceae bacterium]|jgi:DNA-binding NtrC family response regulator|nr:helix-turn-helix domain-containing protein [Bryobacteraceae bacterium]
MKEKFDGLVEHLLAGNIFLEQAIEVLERSMIQRALERSGGNRSEASKLLGIHRNTLQRKLAEYQLADGRGRARRRPAARQGRTRKPKSGAA